MQIAAFRYGFNHAIVSLANDLLTQQDFSLEKELKHVYGLDRNDLVFDLGELQHCPSGAHIAMKLYEFAGANDCAEAWFNLGHLLWTGHEIENNVEKSIEADVERAMECFEKAVILGDDDAKYFMGVTYLGQEEEDVECYESLLDTRRKGLQYIQEAADNGHTGALYYLALLYRNGDDDLEIQPSLDLFQEYLNEAYEACDGGEADSLFLRGHCRYHGDDQHVGFAIEYPDYGIMDCATPATYNSVFWRINDNPLGVTHIDIHGNQYILKEVYQMPQEIRAMTPASTVHATTDIYSARGDGFLVVDITDNTVACEMRGYDYSNAGNGSLDVTKWKIAIDIS
ncbi:hypothetical protein CTEN210_14933 [Chaetoceros tenuissimus]|uniref:Sel1 repeat family protein n=1 Tax=Chaetoceros tenuissimus TaxID=426638 RepID=A0AAD3HC69_9STRA|nr:hypothetical protein CTEN210_14924 [Chaetoceros tenuissimus]GFH58457.1 hypothetical protein CTEN210_14933 [Chaetoceros tenuissimus]